MIRYLLTLSLAWLASRDHRTLRLRNIHTGERVSIQPLRRDGLPLTVNWLRVDHVFQSWRTGQWRPISPRLIRVLAQVQRHFDGRSIELLSGYRVLPGPLHSYHGVGHAADILIPGVANREVFDYCRTLANLGCGLYSRGSHVHVDVRTHSALWVDLSRYGERAEYVRNPRAWVEAHPDAGRGNR
jgi:uncharacterized protein YcbK (DUF882 family)